MRKTSLLLLGAVGGAALMLAATQPKLICSAPARKRRRPIPTSSSTCLATCSSACAPTMSRSPRTASWSNTAINGMLSSLDPHSSYMDGKSFRDMQVQTRGEFGGLGIEVTMEDGLIKVVSPIDDTPAAKAGILANDIITHLDDDAVQGLTLNQAVEKMRGAPNTKIRLKVMRKGKDAPLEITLVRDVIRVRSVRYARGSDDVGLYPTDAVQRADHRRPQARDQRADGADPGRQAQGLCHRHAQQSRRLAGTSHLGVGRLPRQGRDRFHPRTQRWKRRSAAMPSPATC